ncbi:uncharacterized protein THITE_158856 [Thermothielavioides terrestris NRRL 8126]|uniref:Uncharacterized protein n=1 Tax=Thermothielavioides terrestris (strain ATCC 38088 / NRRL 8126) TaxID=578455 RepID=G2RGQ9_THETT|nr:uncharacterized protein THITE_158856 [Thermothielavioides terrestris NRRL 8126]AEO71091.1 hypothetical protein THITE_158856 [Thermothielavioides terrestris NRRL 8126]
MSDTAESRAVYLHEVNMRDSYWAWPAGLLRERVDYGWPADVHYPIGRIDEAPRILQLTAIGSALEQNLQMPKVLGGRSFRLGLPTYEEAASALLARYSFSRTVRIKQDPTRQDKLTEWFWEQMLLVEAELRGPGGSGAEEAAGRESRAGPHSRPAGKRGRCRTAKDKRAPKRLKDDHQDTVAEEAGLSKNL